MNDVYVAKPGGNKPISTRDDVLRTLWEQGLLSDDLLYWRQDLPSWIRLNECYGEADPSPRKSARARFSGRRAPDTRQRSSRELRRPSADRVRCRWIPVVCLVQSLTAGALAWAGISLLLKAGEAHVAQAHLTAGVLICTLATALAAPAVFVVRDFIQRDRGKWPTRFQPYPGATKARPERREGANSRLSSRNS